MDSPFYVIALDGVAGAGKSSTARSLAQKLNITYIDTGAMYRALTLLALRQGFTAQQENELVGLAQTLNFSFDKNNSLWVNNENVALKIRTPEISSQVSHYCLHPRVRAILVKQQRLMAQNQSAVLDGRDIATVVFPHTPFKFFLWASPQARAHRRVLELQNQGIEASFSEVLKNIEERDNLDSNRTHSPLQKADGAILIDTTSLTFDEQVNQIAQSVQNGLMNPEVLESLIQPSTSTH